MTNTQKLVERIRERASVASGEPDELVEFSVTDVLTLVAKLESADALLNALMAENAALRRRVDTLNDDYRFMERLLVQERARQAFKGERHG
jgi:cell division protein FtsB